ncbi:hypothetical protein LCGC14_0499010 [marine sediment metagenome]|uniref:Uncharacterized protein n=1 Tax=marine sediment metagenome TaxID=412755 RepID=A0A0F9S9G6_9ZZZZ
MDISKTSSTYRKYVAGAKSYARFFDKHFFSSDMESVGFCSMMRTIYFWRPLIATTRVLMMAMTVVIVCAAFYLKSTEILAGIVVFLLLALLVWVAKIAVLAGGDYFDSADESLLFQWAKASHDKVCPLVTFTPTEEEKCDE